MPRPFPYLVLVLMLAVSAGVRAQDIDSAYMARVQDSVERYYRRHPRQRLSSEERKFKVMPLYGIMYAQETGLLVMGGFLGSYKTTSDTLVPVSHVGAVAMISTNLSAAAAVTGRRYGAEGRFVMEYVFQYSSSRRLFWGLGYSNACDDSRRGSFTGRRFAARADFLYRKRESLLAGGFVGYDYYRALDFSDSEAVSGLPDVTGYMTVGARFDLDTRDDATAPSHGVMFRIEPSISIPLMEMHTFFRVRTLLDLYFPLWKGGVAAVDLYGDISTEASPWTMWPESGGDVRLRGYYKGRYRDRNMLSVQVELRQKIYRSHGVAVWAGAGNVFPSFGNFEIKNTLPTYGAGYRFSFLGMVLRLDAGFGLPGQWALIAGVSHSF